MGTSSGRAAPRSRAVRTGFDAVVSGAGVVAPAVAGGSRAVGRPPSGAGVRPADRSSRYHVKRWHRQRAPGRTSDRGPRLGSVVVRSSLDRVVRRWRTARGAV